MKFLNILFAVLILSLGPTARAFESDAWVCLGKTAKDTAALKKLKLSTELFMPEIGVLIVSKDNYCGFSSSSFVQDYCRFQGHHLFINKKASLLKTKAGKEIRLECEESKKVEPYGGVGGSN